MQRKPTICSIWLQAGPSRGLPFAAFMHDLNLYGQREGRRGRHVLQKGESIPPRPHLMPLDISPSNGSQSVLSTLNVEDEYVAFCFCGIYPPHNTYIVQNHLEHKRRENGTSRIIFSFPKR